MAASKSDVKIYHGAMVCKETKLRGDITIGSKTVIHPGVRIIAESGPIVIGDGNIIEEQCSIINNRPADDNTTFEERVMRIGNNNVFEVGSHVSALKIGDNNVLEAKTVIGSGVEITNACIVVAGCQLLTPEILSENTLVHGRDCERRKLAENPPSQHQQRDVLIKVLPNYHHLKKSRTSLKESEMQ